MRHRMEHVKRHVPEGVPSGTCRAEAGQNERAHERIGKPDLAV